MDSIINKVIRNDIAKAINSESFIILFLLLLKIKANTKKNNANMNKAVITLDINSFLIY